MSQLEATDWAAEIRQEDLRGLALILEYANEQAQKLALTDTTNLITRAFRSLEMRLADPETYQQNNQVRELQYQHAEIERDLQACYKEWEGLQETLDQLANKNQTEL